MMEFLKTAGSLVLILALIILFAVGYAGSMGEMWEHSFDSARRKCIYDQGTPVDIRKADGSMFAVRCEK